MEDNYIFSNDEIKENRYTKHDNKIKFKFHTNEQEGDINKSNHESLRNNYGLDFNEIKEHMFYFCNEREFEIYIIKKNYDL